MAYKVIILYQLYMPSYFLGTFTEYPYLDKTISGEPGNFFTFTLYLKPCENKNFLTICSGFVPARGTRDIT